MNSKLLDLYVYLTHVCFPGAKLIDFILYFHDNAQSSAQRIFLIHRLIAWR
jgi:hypothetical protein